MDNILANVMTMTMAVNRPYLIYHRFYFVCLFVCLFPKAAEGVLQRKDHILDSSKLSLRLYHPLLEENDEAKQIGEKYRTISGAFGKGPSSSRTLKSLKGT